jgi:hypothetical protein
MPDPARSEQVDFWLANTSRALARPRPAGLVAVGCVGTLGLIASIVAIASLPGRHDPEPKAPATVTDEGAPPAIAEPKGV